MAAVPIDCLVQGEVKLSGDLFSHPDPGRWGEAAANLMPFEPVIDGDVLPARPIDRIVAGAGAGVDLMVGTNTEEERLFMGPNGTINFITHELLVGTIAAY